MADEVDDYEMNEEGDGIEDNINEAMPIIEKYRKELIQNRNFNAIQFEFELRNLWNCGPQRIKRAVNALMEEDSDFSPVAAFYAETIGYHHDVADPFYEIPHESLSVNASYKQSLAELYGATHFHHDKNLQEKRKAYWIGIFQGD